MVTQRVPDTGTKEVCEGALSCMSADLVTVGLGVGVFVLFFLATVVDLRRALSVVETEHSRIADEAAAFEAFANRLAEIEAGRARFDGGRRTAGSLAGARVAHNLELVQEAYRDTVMSVDHYDEEYGESLAANMAMEFGEDVAGAVASGSSLTPQLKRTLLERSRRAVLNRRLLADHLDDEIESLEAAIERLDRVAESVDRVSDEPLEEYDYADLLAEWYLLRDRRAACSEVIEDRQSTVNGRRDLADRVDVVDTLEGYIYEPLEVDYPVLAAGANLLDRVRDFQHRIERGLATRQ